MDKVKLVTKEEFFIDDTAVSEDEPWENLIEGGIGKAYAYAGPKRDNGTQLLLVYFMRQNPSEHYWVFNWAMEYHGELYKEYLPNARQLPWPKLTLAELQHIADNIEDYAQPQS